MSRSRFFLLRIIAVATLAVSLPAAAQTNRSDTPEHAEPAAGAINVVAAASGAVRALSRDEAMQLFLGHRNRLRDGTPVTLVDLPSGPVRDKLYQLLTSKNPVQVRANWSRLVFSGRVRPPREAGSNAEALEWLASTPNAIGYLPADVSDKRLKVLLVVGG